ncbi:non-reducing end alpha-L-arabinofuranosidase family hydrolase [Streptomyces sp. NPDC048430]|uniref:non-reducing end alpha-L-arabinofuranosidase family hydrolase n=1 Tax=unclassified Streptomyces TaxID=2593676 RepID=UPI003421E47E
MPLPYRVRPCRRHACVALLIALLAAFLAVPAKGATPTGALQPGLPSSFRWSSTGPLISPQPDGSNSVAVKDPSVVQDKSGRWHVFMTTASTSGDWSLAETSFDDWSQAAGAKQTHLETASAIGPGYRAAPHAFYFAPKGEWYLVYQTGLPSYSTTKDINDPTSWSAPKNLMNSVPDVVRQNIGNGNWLDFYVICDDVKCYLFSADDNGHVYRSETTVANFPNGFGNTRIVLQDSRFALFEGGAVYRVEGTDTYLLMWEAIGSDGNRYYRSFTSKGLTGTWQPLAATEASPFARSTNVTFPGGAWTKDISHGELLRSTNDQTMTVDPCHLRLLYQGRNPNSSGEYSQLPYRLGLATQTGSAC